MLIFTLIILIFFIIVISILLCKLHFDQSLFYLKPRKLFPISFEINYEKKVFKFYQKNIFFEADINYFYNSFFNVLISKNYFLIKFIFSNIENLYLKYNWISIELIDKNGFLHKFYLNFVFLDINKKKIFCTLIPNHEFKSVRTRLKNYIFDNKLKNKFFLSKVNFLLKINKLINKNKKDKNFYFLTLFVDTKFQEIDSKKIFLKEKLNYVFYLFFYYFFSNFYVSKFEKNVYKIFVYGKSEKKFLKNINLIKKKLLNKFFAYNFFSLNIGVYYLKNNKNNHDIAECLANSELTAMLAKKNKTIFEIYNLQDKDVIKKYFSIEKQILNYHNLTSNQIIIDKKQKTFGIVYDHLYIASKSSYDDFFKNYLNVFFFNNEFKIKYDLKFFVSLMKHTSNLKLKTLKTYVFFALCYETIFEINKIIKIYQNFKNENIIPVLTIDKSYFLSETFLTCLSQLRKNNFQICFTTGKINYLRTDMILKTKPNFVLIKKELTKNSINHFNSLNKLIFFANFCQLNNFNLIISTDLKYKYANYFFDKKINCNYFKIRENTTNS